VQREMVEELAMVDFFARQTTQMISEIRLGFRGEVPGIGIQEVYGGMSS